MTIIPFSHIRWQNRIVAFCLLVIFSLIPIQHRFKGMINSLSKSLIPSDLYLPAHFSKSIHLYLVDPFILLLTLLLLFYFRTPLRSFFWEGPSKILSLFALTCFLSILCSKTAHYPLHYIKLLHFSSALLLFNALVSLRTRLTPVYLVTAFAWVLTLSGLFESILALLQYFNQNALGLSFLGEHNLSRFSFPNPSKQLWLFGPASDAAKLLRASGTFSHPNILGAFLFCSLFSTYYLYLKTTKSLLLPLLFLQVAALYVSYSRSAFVAFFLSTLLFSYLFIKQKKILPLLATLFSAVLLCGVAFLPPLISRGGLLHSTKTTQEADLERIQYMKMAVDMVKENPLLGVGFNQFQLISKPFQETLPQCTFHSKVHNIYLLITAETGLIGCALFLWFLSKILRPAVQNPSPHFIEKNALLSCFLGLLIIGCFDFFLLDTSPGRLLLFSMAALLYISSVKPQKNP